MSRIALIAVSVLMAGSTAALAHSNQARLAEQQRWIEAGRNNGSITWREGIKLRREQREIAELKSDFEADGRLNRAERRELHQLQNKAQNHIVHESHDGWRRLWWLPRFGY